MAKTSGNDGIFTVLSSFCLFKLAVTISSPQPHSAMLVLMVFPLYVLNRGDDYKNHNKCISEDQKYGGKGYEAKANKGDVKQQQWIQVKCR